MALLFVNPGVIAQGDDHEFFGESCPITTLFFVIRNLGQDRRLELADSFGLFFFLERIERLTGRIDQSRGHEDDEVALDMLLGVGAEKPADQAGHRR